MNYKHLVILLLISLLMLSFASVLCDTGSSGSGTATSDTTSSLTTLSSIGTTETTTITSSSTVSGEIISTTSGTTTDPTTTITGTTDSTTTGTTDSTTTTTTGTTDSSTTSGTTTDPTTTTTTGTTDSTTTGTTDSSTTSGATSDSTTTTTTGTTDSTTTGTTDSSTTSGTTSDSTTTTTSSTASSSGSSSTTGGNGGGGTSDIVYYTIAQPNNPYSDGILTPNPLIPEGTSLYLDLDLTTPLSTPTNLPIGAHIITIKNTTDIVAVNPELIQPTNVPNDYYPDLTIKPETCTLGDSSLVVVNVAEYTSVDLQLADGSSAALTGTDTFASLHAGEYTLVLKSAEFGVQNIPITIETYNPSIYLTFVPNECPLKSQIQVQLVGITPQDTPVFTLNGNQQVTNGIFTILPGLEHIVKYTANGCQSSAEFTVPTSPIYYPVSHSVGSSDKCSGKVTVGAPASYDDIIVLNTTVPATPTPITFNAADSSFQAVYGDSYAIYSPKCTLVANSPVHTITNLGQPSTPIISIGSASGQCLTTSTVQITNYLNFDSLNITYSLDNGNKVVIDQSVNGVFSNVPYTTSASVVYTINGCDTPVTVPVGFTQPTQPTYTVKEVLKTPSLCTQQQGSMEFQLFNSRNLMVATKTMSFFSNSTLEVVFDNIENTTLGCTYTYTRVFPLADPLMTVTVVNPNTCNTMETPTAVFSITMATGLTLAADSIKVNGTASPVDIVTGQTTTTYGNGVYLVSFINPDTTNPCSIESVVIVSSTPRAPLVYNIVTPKCGDAVPTSSITVVSPTDYNQLKLDDTVPYDETNGWASLIPGTNHTISYYYTECADDKVEVAVSLPEATIINPATITITQPVTDCNLQNGLIKIVPSSPDVTINKVVSEKGIEFSQDGTGYNISSIGCDDGVFDVIITYASTCEYTQSVDMSVTPLTAPVFQVNNLPCQITGASISVTTGNFNLQLTDSTGLNVFNADPTLSTATETVYTGLVAGLSYTLTGNDKNTLIPFADTVIPIPTITPIADPSTTLFTTVGETCSGGFDGTITLTNTNYFATVSYLGNVVGSTVKGVVGGLTSNTYTITTSQVANPYCLVNPPTSTSTITALYTPDIQLTSGETCMVSPNSFGYVSTVFTPSSANLLVNYSIVNGSNYQLATSTDGTFNVGQGSYNVIGEIVSPQCRRKLTKPIQVAAANKLQVTYNTTVCQSLGVSVVIPIPAPVPPTENDDPAPTIEYTITVVDNNDSSNNFTNIQTNTTLSKLRPGTYTINVISTSDKCSIVYSDVVVAKCAPPPEPTEAPKKSNAGKLAAIIIPITIVVVGAGVAAYFILKKKLGKKYHHPILMDSPKYKLMMDA